MTGRPLRQRRCIVSVAYNLDKLAAKPIRRCYSLHECRICGFSIVCGDNYHDGGHGNRAHTDCVDVEMDARKRLAHNGGTK
jgi:hypothetical protein